MANDSGTFLCTDPIHAHRYDGTRESAYEIARSFGLRVVVIHHPGMAVVFDVPPGLTLSPGQEREGTAFGVTPGGWVWHNPKCDMVGAEWDDYFRDHFATVSAHDEEHPGEPVTVPDGYEAAGVSAAKNIVMCELEGLVAEANENAGPTDDGQPYDAIDLAEIIVEKLITAGVSVPDSVVDPISLTPASSDAL